MPFIAALLTSLAINFGIYLLTGFLTPGRKQDVGKPTFPTADPERYLPWIFGTVRMPINVFWNGKIRTVDIKRTRNIIFGWGPSDVIGHQYWYTLAGWLCYGGLSGFCDIVIDGKYFLSRITPQMVRDDEGVDGTVVSTVTDVEGNTVNIYRPNYTSTTGMSGGVTWFSGKAPNGVTIDVKIPALFGDPVGPGGVQGRFRIYPGDGSHNQNAALAALNPNYAKAVYPEWSYLVLEDVWLGNSGNPPGVEIVVCRATAKLSLGNPLIAYPNSPFGGAFNSFAQGDANPVGTIYELLINKKTGVGFPRALIDFGSFQATYTDLNPWEAGDDYGLSGAVFEQSAAEDTISSILAHIDAVLFMDPTTGLLTIRLIREYTGSVGSLPLLDETNILNLEWNYQIQNETVNELQVEFTNLYRDLKSDIVKVQNLAAIQRAGRVNSERVQFLFATRPDIALKIAQRELRVASSKIGRGNLTLTRGSMMLTPGQHVRVTHPDVGTDVVCRVGAVNFGTLGQGGVTASIMQDRWLSENSSYVAPPPDETNQPAGGAVPFYPPWVDVNVASDTTSSIIYNLIVSDPFNVVTAVEYQIQYGTSPVSAWVAGSGPPYSLEVIKGLQSFRAFWRVTYVDPNGVTQYISDEFPQPVSRIDTLNAPRLSYAYVGTNVVIDAAIDPPATGVRFASGTTAPSDATVLAATPDTTIPYKITVAAPTAPDLLYVGAAATDGVGNNSKVVRVTIPPAPQGLIPTPSIQFPFGSGTFMAVLNDWLQASPSFNWAIVGWDIVALDSSNLETPIDITFSLTKLVRATGATSNIVNGGTAPSLAAQSINSGNAASYLTGNAKDVIIAKITALNPGVAKSVLLTLTLARTS